MKRYILGLAAALALAVAPAVQAGPKGPSIVDVAIAANAAGPFQGQFDSLITAVVNADPIVADVLSGNGQFTVFAPTDTAFEKLGLTPEVITSITSTPEGQALITDVLLYHVAHGRQSATSVTRKNRIRMLKFGFVFPEGTTLTDNVGRNAEIIAPNVRAANGIIHGIDTVVLPFELP